MAVTSDQIAEVRRLVNEPTQTPYADALITSMLEKYPRGIKDEDDEFTDYDENLASADIWFEKAAVVAVDYDTTTDGAGLKRSQVYNQFIMQGKMLQQRSAGTSIPIVVEGISQTDFDQIFNV